MLDVKGNKGILVSRSVKYFADILLINEQRSSVKAKTASEKTGYTSSLAIISDGSAEAEF